MYRTPTLKTLNADASGLIQSKVSQRGDNNGQALTKPSMSPALEAK
jgi:hypothetical protein